jgi:hypothetical protein
MLAYGAWFLAGKRRPPAVGKRELAMDLANLRHRNDPDHRPGVEARRVPGEEASVPRWLRKSVREERFWTPPPAPRQAVIERPQLSRFAPPPVLDAATRQPVHARVALLNVPNEALSTPITQIGRGEDVEILQVAGEWLRVRTAIGDEGWIQSSALGAPPPS